MNLLKINSTIVSEVIEISKLAGKAIMDIYSTDFDYKIKSDNSPLTKADLESNQLIVRELKKLNPLIPVLSEEESDVSLEKRMSWEQYWLIDPLDGTKEFLKRNGEFTVNIALINNNKPIFGVIHIPVSNKTYWGSNQGSYYQKEESSIIEIKTKERGPNNKIKIVSSRSHHNSQLDKFLKNLENYELINMGSSVKFCLVASGIADLYLRFGPTSEWDNAAGHAILKYAGGRVRSINGDQISYNLKKDFLIKNFIASRNSTLEERILKELAFLN